MALQDPAAKSAPPTPEERRELAAMATAVLDAVDFSKAAAEAEASAAAVLDALEAEDSSEAEGRASAVEAPTVLPKVEKFILLKPGIHNETRYLSISLYRGSPNISFKFLTGFSSTMSVSQVNGEQDLYGIPNKGKDKAKLKELFEEALECSKSSRNVSFTHPKGRFGEQSMHEGTVQSCIRLIDRLTSAGILDKNGTGRCQFEINGSGPGSTNTIELIIGSRRARFTVQNDGLTYKSKDKTGKPIPENERRVPFDPESYYFNKEDGTFLARGRAGYTIGVYLASLHKKLDVFEGLQAQIKH